MNRKVFFEYIRNAPLGGRISESQMDGLNRILDYKESKYKTLSNNRLAYILATVFHETAKTFQPVREMGGEKYLRSKKYYPWVGEGLVQVTWEANHRKFGATKPGQLLTWEKALPALFDGMTKGMFTGKKLGDYFSGNKADPVGARAIVNGTDKAKLIRDYFVNFKNALDAAQDEEKVKKIEVDKPDADKPDGANVSTSPATIGVFSSFLASLAAFFNPENLTNTLVVIAFVLILSIAAGAILWDRIRIKKNYGV